MTRANPRGLVWRKSDAKLRADEQEPHMRRRLEASWHKTTKPCDLTATVNEAAVQGQFMLLSGEICLPCDRSTTSKALVYKCLGSQVSSTGESEPMNTDSAAGGDPGREQTEVSRRHSSQMPAVMGRTG